MNEPLRNLFKDVELTREQTVTLLLKAQQGDEDALEEIYSAWQPFIAWIVNTIGKGLDDQEDLMQSGQVGLTQAIQTYDRLKGAFSTWAYFKIRREVQGARRATFLISLSDVAVSKGVKVSTMQLEEEWLVKHEDFDYDKIDSLNLLKEIDNYVKRTSSKRDYKVFCDFFYKGRLLREIDIDISKNIRGYTGAIISDLRKRIKKRFSHYKNLV